MNTIPCLKLWSILQLLSATFGYFRASAVSFNQHSNQQISVIDIESFNSNDHMEKTVEFAIFPPPYIRINFFAFDRTFGIDLVKDSKFYNSSTTLRVVGAKDNLTIDWEPPIYKTTDKLNGIITASGMYHRRKNTFTGVVFLKNAMYYLEPAKYHFSEYSKDDSALLITKVDRSISTLPDVNWDVNKGKPNIVCNMDLYGDHTYFNWMRNFENAAGLMVYHAEYLDKMFHQHDVGPKHLRFFPKRSTINFNYFKKTYPNMTTMIDEFSRVNDTACISALFTFRTFQGGAEVGISYNNGACRKMQQEVSKITRQRNKAMITIEYLKKFAPICASLIYLTHEVGHTLGCQHDPRTFGSPCSPNKDSRFFMYPLPDPTCIYTQPRYSPCCLSAMRQFIENIYKIGRACFKVY